MALFIPRSLLVEQRQTLSPSIVLVVYLGLNDLVGRRATSADLLHALIRYRRSDVIRWVATISSWIAGSDAAVGLKNQLKLADDVLPAELRDGLRKWIDSNVDRRWSLFHRRQLWFVLQMAVVACKEDDALACDEETLRRGVGECCLMASDVIQQIEGDRPIREGSEEANKWMAGMAIPLMERKDQQELVARAQHFWFDLPNDVAIRKRFEEVGAKDFTTAFEDHYGFPLRELFLLLAALYAFFQTGAMRRTALLVEQKDNLLPLFASDVLQRALGHLLQRPDSLALDLFGSPRQNWSTDMTPLREFPLIEVFDGQLACPDLGLLYRTLTDKVYFMLQKAYPEQMFARLFGYIFEGYLNRFFRRFTYEGEILWRSFYPAPKFHQTNDEAGDGIVHWHQTALVMEYKSRLLTTREKYGIIQETTLAGVDLVIGSERDKKKGVNQLAKVVRRLIAGEKVVSGSAKPLDLKSCPRICPVLVTYEETLALEAVRQQANARFVATLDDDSSTAQVGPLLILSVLEVELLEALAPRYSPEDVIREYIEHLSADPRNRAGSFYSFVGYRGYLGTGTSQTSLVIETYKHAMDAIAEELEMRQATYAAQSAAGPTGPNQNPAGDSSTQARL